MRLFLCIFSKVDLTRNLEIEEVKSLRKKAVVIIRGGSIPVVENENGMPEDVADVIDKDFADELLAEQIDTDALVILTGVVDKIPTGEIPAAAAGGGGRSANSFALVDNSEI